MLPNDLPCFNNLEITRCPQFLVEGSSIRLPSLTSIAMNDVPLTSLQVVPEMRSMVADEVISANAKSKHPSSITSLSIGMIKKLVLLPKWVPHGPMELEALKITSCEELKTLWTNVARVQHSLPAFRHLEIEGYPQLISLFEEDEDDEDQHQQQQEEGLPCIVRLEHLTIDNCEKLEKLPRLLHTLTFLRELLKYMPDALPNNNSLSHLFLYGCKNLESIPEGWFYSATNLRELDVRGCKKLKDLQLLPHGLQTINYLTSLHLLEMNISHWNNNFKKLGLHSLSSLTTLLISGREEEDLVGFSFPIDGMLLPTSVISLYIGGYPRPKSLPVQRLPSSLNTLSIWGSWKLTGKCEKGKGKYWPHLSHIPQVYVHG
ncbi:uncharacterized protein LOC114268281 [Camellia sinensis]|uniref:uncharacterized protein LOC114268281 n=1 Tax=Camellia sinensis TaxID=4442 RepID=UPI0010364481|nr:uncharacterized protein LOC114268281 [Camellia sinensis]